jgi:hypothetical protein
VKIFVASTGRCGTAFFAKVFGELTAYPSYHEPMPYVVGRSCREVNTRLSYSPDVEKELVAKVEQVRDYSVAGDYMESSQMFIKSYSELMLKAFKRVAVIYIERNPMDVLLSFAEKCRDLNSDWMLQSHWQKNILRTARPLGFFENVLWNWFEVRERFLELRPKVTTHYSFVYEDLNNAEAWKEMFATLGVPHVPFDCVPWAAENKGKVDIATRRSILMSEWGKQGHVVTDENPGFYNVSTGIAVHERMVATLKAQGNAGKVRRLGDGNVHTT